MTKIIIVTVVLCKDLLLCIHQHVQHALDTQRAVVSMDSNQVKVCLGIEILNGLDIKPGLDILPVEAGVEAVADVTGVKSGGEEECIGNIVSALLVQALVYSWLLDEKHKIGRQGIIAQ